jgi:hypothetical protein
MQKGSGGGRRLHVLVASWYGNHTVEPVTSGDSLDGVCDEIARLERVAHTKRSIADTIRDAGCAELVSDETGLVKRLCDALSESEQVLVASWGIAIGQLGQKRPPRV